MIFRKNNLNIGIGLGIIFPMLFVALVLGTIALFHKSFKPRTVALIGLCSNMILIELFRKTRANESIRGTVIATVCLAVVWFIYFGQEIMEEF
jgi:ABC-type spermidine/putrescine transport system permease subunit II